MLPPISLDARTPLGGTSTRLARPSLTVALLLVTGCAVTHDVPPCDPAAGECCNGADDDADGRVDEGRSMCVYGPELHGACAYGHCVVHECEDAFADCNGDPEDGCETDLSRSVHCGACDTVCGDREECLDGACVTVEHRVIAMVRGTCSLRAGRVLCVGSNDHRQLADSDEAVITVPTDPVGRDDIIDVAGGTYHFCALTRAGEVYCRGYNEHGEVDPTRRGSEPLGLVRVSILSGPAVELEGASDASCVLLEAGDVQCWGWNIWGPIGLRHTDSPAYNTVPIGPVAHLRGDVRQTSCALGRDGSLAVWGGPHHSRRIGVYPLDDDARIARPGYDGSCIVIDSEGRGTVFRPAEARGMFRPAEAGGDLTTLPGDTDIEPIEDSGAGWPNFHCLLAGDGTRVHCSGDGSAYGRGYEPRWRTLVFDEPVRDLSVGYGHACVTGRERAYCWGRSELGQLGVMLPDWSTAIETPVEIDW